MSSDAFLGRKYENTVNDESGTICVSYGSGNALMRKEVILRGIYTIVWPVEDMRR